MKGYLIDAGARSITEIDYTYKSMRDYLPGGLCIAATFQGGDVLYVDDEALLHEATVAFRVKQRRDGQPMLSNGVLTGRDNPDPRSNNTLPPSMTPAQLAAQIEWLTLEQALAWFQQRAGQPAVTITTAGRKKVLATWGDMMRNLEGKADGYKPY